MFDRAETRYAIFGVLFGLMFPAGSVAFERYVIGSQFSSPGELFALNPIHAIVCMAPFVLGFTFWRLGVTYARVQAQMHRAQEAEQDLSLIVKTDTLTGRGNRYSLGHDIRELEMNGSSGRVLLIDLDKFKFINDTLGHHVGDALLISLSERVGEIVADKGTLYRLGGDEFVVLCNNCDDAGAAELAGRIGEAVSQPV